MTSYALTNPTLGSSSGEVEVDDREITIRHPLLRGMLQLPLAGIAGAVAGPQDVGEPVVARRARQLTFASTAADEPTVTLVLSQPVLVIGFKRGAEEHFPISSGERRNGVEIDAVGLGVEDEAGFLAALRDRGVRTDLARDRPRTDDVGPATTDEIETPPRTARGAGLGPILALGAVLLVTTALLSWAIASIESTDIDEASLGLVVAIGLASLAWSVVIATVVAAWPVAPPTGSVDAANARRRRAFLASLVAMVIVPAVLLGVLQSDAGDSEVARVILGGLLVGFVNGVLLGVALRIIRRRRRAATGPVSPPR